MWNCDPMIASRVAQGYQTTCPVMVTALQTMLAAQCLVNVFKDPDEEELERLATGSYDFIVVGAGTAGSVVAHGLLEAGNWTVLLLEAGGEPTLASEIPALFINNYGTNEDWNFRTEPQKNACRNYKEQRCYWPRGKVLGGTSSINGMYYIKGNKKDFDDWGLDNWTYEKVKKYFYSGYDSGIMNIEKNIKNHLLEDMILKANEEIGVSIVDDINGDNQIGVGIAPTTTKKGKRYSVFDAYLKPFKNENRLTVLKNTYVDQVSIINDVALGVDLYSKKNFSKLYFAKATKDVILSAGTINSAVILLKSGIGPEYIKTYPDIEHFVTLSVGKNLQDHIYAPVMFKVNSDDDSNATPNVVKSFYEYASNKSGPLTDLRPQRVVSFINTTDMNSKTPDIQNHFIVVYPNQSNIVDIFGQHRFSDQFYNAFNELNKNHLIIIVYVTLLQPKSKGEIVINADNSVKIDANYLDVEDDIETIVNGMKHVLQLETTSAFRNNKVEVHWIGIDACKNMNKTTDEHLKCIAKELTGTLYHAVGTNKMGKEGDSSAVVDDKLQVRGVDNLRVIDASVMPKIIRGNTMAATLMIAEKGLEYIKEYWLDDQ